MLGGLGPVELLVIFVVVLLLFGAKRVPEIGASIGKGIREFKRNVNDVQRQLEEPMREQRADRPASEPIARAPLPEDDTAREPKRLL
ncbi:MAG TPA: twin-arginine translocase TatA/TatE family subunit [Gemmatimonadaceae bacterium]|jgi:sec-independent protein translocase protein TatA|nr:twin-arginine translocase TatA/TatE family subunit [Gemmatimonadaceae bacterium]